MPAPLNILLTPVGSAGDNFPFIGLASELARRGHRVSVATTEHFAPLARAAGARVLQTGTTEEYLRIINNPRLWHATGGFKTVMSLLTEQVNRLFAIEMRQLEQNPDTVFVSHSLDFAARAIFDKFAMPLVAVHLQPTIVRSLHQMPVMTGSIDFSFLPRFFKRAFWWFIDRAFIDRHAEPLANDIRQRLGLAPIRHPFDAYIHRASVSIGMWPQWFAPAQPDYPANFRQTGFPLFEAPDAQPVPPELDVFLSAGPPPVAFTPGSAHMFADDFFASAVDAMQRLNRRAILLTRHIQHIPANLPTSILHIPFAPLTRILPRCAALVHHGGIGTTAAALASGTPQLICPMSHDQPDNAARIVRLGAGDRLMPRKFTPRRLATTLENLLQSEQVKTSCAKTADACLHDHGIPRTCDIIESLRR